MKGEQRLRVELGKRSYDIVAGGGLFERAGEILKPVIGRKKLIVVTDTRVAAAQWARLEQGLRAAGIPATLIVLPPGETTKSWSQLGGLIDSILDTKPERGTILLALGGGVIGDLTGVAASLVLRGIDFIQAPTTLLAQVDSAVGGKTGVNTRHGKNLIGAFYQPKIVLSDLDALSTLPRRELLAGYAEVVKYGLIDEPEFFAWLEQNGKKVIDGDAAARAHAVITSCKAKARIVAEDEREQSVRALLNLGHTFGHALEAAIGYGDKLLHGEAVAMGMIMAFDLSAQLGLCPQEDCQRIRRHYAAVGLPIEPASLNLPASALRPERLVELMAQDKKVADGRITFILARGIGKSFVARDVDLSAVRALLAQSVPA
jgi:3-dehydroquinate synthase